MARLVRLDFSELGTNRMRKLLGTPKTFTRACSRSENRLLALDAALFHKTMYLEVNTGKLVSWTVYPQT